MKTVAIGCCILLFAACERFPANPPTDYPPEPRITIEHLSTDYVPVDTTITGIASDKVNVLMFHIKAENFTAKAIEFYGTAVMAGPPDSVEHVVHFRTDDLNYSLNGTGYEFNTLDQVDPDLSYILVRAKFPSNEYAPFDGIQGMIESITITEVWGYSQTGEKFTASICRE